MYRLLLIAGFLLTTFLANGQDNGNDKPDKITFIAGWNNSKYVGGTDQTDKSDFKSGLILGINKDVKLMPFLWGNGGLQYYQNGADTKVGTYKFDYLMLPAGLKLRFGPVYAMGGGTGRFAFRPNWTIKNSTTKIITGWILEPTLV